MFQLVIRRSLWGLLSPGVSPSAVSLAAPISIASRDPRAHGLVGLARSLARLAGGSWHAVPAGYGPVEMSSAGQLLPRRRFAAPLQNRSPLRVRVALSWSALRGWTTG
uniref:Secreted protein n=1 Tax=Caenorhabditis japonica TaxID=281687 RepID=A0A8R1IF28_CAEJA